MKCCYFLLNTRESGGNDDLIPEIFIDCKDILSPILGKLFNYMFNNSLYPKSWTEGIIVPVPKKGDPNNVNNYRGITLTSIFSKIFSIVLNKRLNAWAENNDILSDSQFGFRKNRSTIDCVFSLTSIIQNVLSVEKKKLYIAFVDFKKAFDLVYRDGIWYKLINYGATLKIVRMLQSIYESVKSCVRVNQSLTNYFESHKGVKQGEPLSPLLFLFFINDIKSQLYDDRIDCFKIEEIQLFVLLFCRRYSLIFIYI